MCFNITQIIYCYTYIILYQNTISFVLPRSCIGRKSKFILCQHLGIYAVRYVRTCLVFFHRKKFKKNRFTTTHISPGKMIQRNIDN